MKRIARRLAIVGVFHALLMLANPALAQNWSFDARNIGMGGVGSTSNVAVDMVDERLISAKQAILRVDPDRLNELVHWVDEAGAIVER